MAPHMMQTQYLRSKDGRLGSCQDRIQRSHSQDEGDIAPEAFRTLRQAAPPSQSRGWVALLEPRLDAWAGEMQAHASPYVVPSPETVMLRDTLGGAEGVQTQGGSTEQHRPHPCGPLLSATWPPPGAATSHVRLTVGRQATPRDPRPRGQNGLRDVGTTPAPRTQHLGLFLSTHVRTTGLHQPPTTLSAGSAVRTSPGPQLTPGKGGTSDNRAGPL